jgi:hypothetical protein
MPGLGKVFGDYQNVKWCIVLNVELEEHSETQPTFQPTLFQTSTMLYPLLSPRTCWALLNKSNNARCRVD